MKFHLALSIFSGIRVSHFYLPVKSRLNPGRNIVQAELRRRRHGSSPAALAAGLAAAGGAADLVRAREVPEERGN